MNVGFKLYREVRDYAPQDWTPAERVVAWTIADDARDTTRRSWIPADLLAFRTGLTKRGVRDALQRLGERGYEFRVTHGKGKDGRPVYGARGHEVEYEVPSILALATVHRLPEGHGSVPPSERAMPP